MSFIRWGLLLSILGLWLVGQRGFRIAPAQNSCNFVQNVERQRVSWKGELPVRLKVHKSVPLEARPSIENAVANYERVLGKKMFLIDEWGTETGSDSPAKDGASIIYWMKTWESMRAKEQARTTLYWNGNEINEADIRINAANFGFTFGDLGNPAQIDLESLMIHELGHVLGLTHDSTYGSVMNFSLNSGQFRRHLGTVDLASLHCEY